ncbi:WD-40 repeat-containing protein [Musa troglodytarum]|uniref:WD-40 repeat-containing protein n=1 Tax=Musa troglodytarum TaxID=320322 RepID=A0A9E7KDZ7_9LILI|nr:WD-40 repeat-containing protein [Musa troglodytarum]
MIRFITAGTRRRCSTPPLNWPLGLGVRTADRIRFAVARERLELRGMVVKGRRKKSAPRPLTEEDEGYLKWKVRIPLIYDWFTNDNLSWPSLSCRKRRFAPGFVVRVEGGVNNLRKRHIRTSNVSIFLNGQTDGTYPNTLVIANCEVVKPRTAAAEHISVFDEESQSPYVKKIKTIIHPGEVNRIRELPQNRRDNLVVLWCIRDHVSSLANTTSLGVPVGSPSCMQSMNASEDKISDSPTVAPRSVFHGHKDTVEDVQFCHFSVGDDSCLILWDARAGRSPALKWSPDKSSVFGSAGEDNLINIWDYEKVGASYEHFMRTPTAPPGLFFQHAGHRDKVVDFHWNATEPWTIASVSDDCARVNGGGTLQVWRMSDLIHRHEDEVLAELEMGK